MIYDNILLLLTLVGSSSLKVISSTLYVSIGCTSLLPDCTAQPITSLACYYEWVGVKKEMC